MGLGRLSQSVTATGQNQVPTVTDRDIQSAPWLTSRSVTSTGQIFLYVLQIETNGRHDPQTSQSVTVTEQNRPQLLQIKTEGNFRPVQTKSLSLPAISNMWPIMLLWLRYILRSHLIRRPPGGINSYRHIG